MKIALVHIKDKQAFAKEKGILRLVGNPLDVARKLKEKGFRLIHIVDDDALKGLAKNLDVYDKLTYFINVQVECAPKEELLRKLLSLRCRVVVPPETDISSYEEKNLFVAKVSKGYAGNAAGFSDVLLEDASMAGRFPSKRIIVYGMSVKKVWGNIIEGYD